MDEDDIDDLLAETVPVPREYKEEPRPKIERGAYKNAQPKVDANKLMEQAKYVRKNLKQAKARNPQLKGMTDEEVLKMCDQWEEAAKDPEKMRIAQEMSENMSKKDMDALKDAQQAAQTKASTAGREMSDFDVMMELRRRNPTQFRNLIKRRLPQAGGMSDEQLDSLIKNLDGMSDEQLKQTMDMGQSFQTYYKKLDDATGGYGKIAIGAVLVIVAVIVIYLIYILSTTAWYYGKGFIYGNGDAAQGQEDHAFSDSSSSQAESSGGGKNTEYDEF